MEKGSGPAHLCMFRHLRREDTVYKLTATPLLVSWYQKLIRWNQHNGSRTIWNCFRKTETRRKKSLKFHKMPLENIRMSSVFFDPVIIMKCLFCALGCKGPHSYTTTKYKVYSSLFFLKNQIYNSNITYLALPNSWIFKSLVSESAFCSVVSI